MKKILTVLLASLVSCASLSSSFAETQSFKITVIIPALVQAPETITTAATLAAAASVNPNLSQSIEEQWATRGGETILIRSIVAL